MIRKFIVAACTVSFVLIGGGGTRAASVPGSFMVADIPPPRPYPPEPVRETPAKPQPPKPGLPPEKGDAPKSEPLPPSQVSSLRWVVFGAGIFALLIGLLWRRERSAAN